MLTISGQRLWQWRVQAHQTARYYHVCPTEVDWLLQEVSDLEGLDLHLETFKIRHDIPLMLPWSEIEQLWQRRLTVNIPVQYLVGKTYWREFSLKVTPAVLIPRPETEYLIDLALRAVQTVPENRLQSGDWVDLGTGSGAIALGLATMFPQATIHAVDCSLAALAIAQKNVAQYDLRERIHCYQGSWWSPLETLRGKVCGMVANPPYIPTGAIADLQPEVSQHEPHLALDGGADGLAYLRELADTAPTYLRPGGVWLVEMMAGQGEAVAKLLRDCGAYRGIEIVPDFAGCDRYALAYRQETSSNIFS